ncbi:NAD(P)-binding protein [Whalleya microplaca]|nr:NAD(P)-binding protein [Whalleya microplaca]
MAEAPPFPPPKRPLTWLITGASSGFGLSLARLAQARGHTVIATSRNPARTPDLAREIEARGGRWLELDVDDAARGPQLVEELEAGGTAVDVLVNCAGFAIYGAAEGFSDDEVRREFETLFFGPYRLMRAVAPHMRRRRFGVIANVSSSAALQPVLAMGIYGAAKAAQDSISKVMAREMNPFNVRILCINPSVFDTNMKNVLQFQEKPLDQDYEGSVLDMTLKHFKSGSHVPEGDTEKAVKAIYEVIVCEGVGEGREKEQVLPLGCTAAKQSQQIVDNWTHTLDVFRDVAVSVDHDKARK